MQIRQREPEMNDKHRVSVTVCMRSSIDFLPFAKSLSEFPVIKTIIE